jgi:hypothetical protein
VSQVQAWGLGHPDGASRSVAPNMPCATGERVRGARMRSAVVGTRESGEESSGSPGPVFRNDPEPTSFSYGVRSRIFSVPPALRWRSARDRTRALQSSCYVVCYDHNKLWGGHSKGESDDT